MTTTLALKGTPSALVKVATNLPLASPALTVTSSAETTESSLFFTVTLAVALEGLYLLFPLYTTVAVYSPGVRSAVDMLACPLELVFNA